MESRHTDGASVVKTANGWRLATHGSTTRRYRDAQLDDYTGLSRRNFPHHTLTMCLEARASDKHIPGTWGFGLWNDPFGLSLGFGGTPFRLPALPNSIWFFHASEENYLSLRTDKPANGFLAQVFCSPRFSPSLILAGLIFPFSPKPSRRILCGIIEEDARSLELDVTEWHQYKLEWNDIRSSFWVDDIPIFQSCVSPRPPLGMIIWIDNQYAAFPPDGNIKYGVLDSGEAWLEIAHLKIEKDPA